MDIQQAEKLKVQILERRNYLRNVDIPLKYSKTSLYRGMQERVRRKADRTFKKGITQQKKVIDKKLQTIDKYIQDRTIYNQNLTTYNEALKIPVNENLIGVQSVSSIAPISPIAPSESLPLLSKKNKASIVRRRKIGIKSRRYS